MDLMMLSCFWLMSVPQLFACVTAKSSYTGKAGNFCISQKAAVTGMSQEQHSHTYQVQDESPFSELSCMGCVSGQ